MLDVARYELLDKLTQEGAINAVLTQSDPFINTEENPFHVSLSKALCSFQSSARSSDMCCPSQDALSRDLQ
ncbi:hypothetical protein J6590_076272 [Homalodisca vitripennis]|nr:hypothetical protein J6590_076272 [Homalodisca vitripennis]